MGPSQDLYKTFTGLSRDVTASFSPPNTYLKALQLLSCHIPAPINNYKVTTWPSRSVKHRPSK